MMVEVGGGVSALRGVGVSGELREVSSGASLGRGGPISMEDAREAMASPAPTSGRLYASLVSLGDVMGILVSVGPVGDAGSGFVE